MITIKDISKKSGFSVTTVSKALNNYPDVSKKTRGKILALAKDMGYIPNSTARNLVRKRSDTIGIIFDELSGVGLRHPLFSKILESFKHTVELEGFDILFLSHEINGTKSSYLNHSLRKQAEGVFVVCADFQSDEMVEMYDSSLPLVVIDFEDERVCNVTANNQQGVFLAVDKFIQSGHKKIADIHGGKNTFIGGVRKKAFEDAMAHYSYDVPESYSVEGEYFSKEEGYHAMEELMAIDDAPTAVFCASDMMAIGAIQAIRDNGKSVPDDFSVIGFDGIEMGQVISPHLTTFRQDTEKMGEIAGKRLLSMIEKRKRNGCNSIVVDGELIDGETVKECL